MIYRNNNHALSHDKLPIFFDNSDNFCDESGFYNKCIKKTAKVLKNYGTSVLCNASADAMQRKSIIFVHNFNIFCLFFIHI